MKKWILVTGFFVFALFLCCSIPVFAATAIPSVLGYDLVDSGGHMDYCIGDTKYSSYIWGATNTWNNYLGEKVIREDTAATITDCDIYDNYQPDVGWVARTGDYGFCGAMELNPYYMDELSATKILHVLKHEFGHTLGCDENDCSDLNIMYPSVKSNSNLTIHDKASVDLARESW